MAGTQGLGRRDSVLGRGEAILGRAQHEKDVEMGARCSSAGPRELGDQSVTVTTTITVSGLGFELASSC